MRPRLTSGPASVPPHVVLALLGIALVLLTSIVGSGFSPLALPFAAWAALPYGALLLVGRAARDRWALAGAGAAALAAELGIRAAVFIWPRGSTAAIALVFSPAYIAVLIMPAGAALGWLAGKLWAWRLASRVIVAVVAPAVLALLFVGLARPELFPTAVLSRRAALERIGPPRVALGSDAFETINVSSKPAWRVTGDLDERPGDELAIVDHQGADLVDPGTFETNSRVDFPKPHGSLWTSFSTLVRLPGSGLAVADTGGGFSPTRLRQLNGTLLWEYRPDPALAPQALRPADLDGDGVVEFYGASTTFVARLDVEGREVWRQPSSLASIAAALPQTTANPAWVVGVEYGRRAIVWNADGQLLGERDISSDDGPVAAVDFSAWRALVQGRRSVRGHALNGAMLFDIRLGDDFALTQAAGVRFSAERPPFLAVVAATDRDTSRWRLLIVDPELRPVYDEILDHFVSVLTAQRSDGSQVLFINGSSGLNRLRPRE